MAPARKPIADAARYQTPKTFSSTVYTTNVSSVFETPTMPNLTNWTISGAPSVRRSRDTLVARSSVAGRLAGITDRMNDKFIYGLSRWRKIGASRQLP